MSKELFVSSTPHETKVAISEDDQLTEVYFERENEYTLAGSIYKGRVTRVLPGMQSAFVDIGLERDAFLYVTDFFEAQGDEDGEFETLPAQADAGRRPQDDQPQILEEQPAFESREIERTGQQQSYPAEAEAAAGSEPATNEESRHSAEPNDGNRGPRGRFANPLAPTRPPHCQ